MWGDFVLHDHWLQDCKSGMRTELVRRLAEIIPINNNVINKCN